MGCFLKLIFWLLLIHFGYRWVPISRIAILCLLISVKSLSIMQHPLGEWVSCFLSDTDTPKLRLSPYGMTPEATKIVVFRTCTDSRTVQKQITNLSKWSFSPFLQCGIQLCWSSVDLLWADLSTAKFLWINFNFSGWNSKIRFQLMQLPALFHFTCTFLGLIDKIHLNVLVGLQR